MNVMYIFRNNYRCRPRYTHTHIHLPRQTKTLKCTQTQILLKQFCGTLVVCSKFNPESMSGTQMPYEYLRLKKNW